jgi:hypothetical protein
MPSPYQVNVHPSSRPRVMIATPTPGTVKTGYMKSVIATIRDLARRGIESEFDTWEGSDIASQRNVLASRFLRADGFTHLFFVDSDLIMPPDLCARLISPRKPVIGAVYPAKTFNIAEVEQAVRDGVPLQDALLGGMSWHFWAPSKTPTQPVCEVDALPFGAVLIQRAVLATIIAKGFAPEDKAPESAGGPRNNFFGARGENVARGRHIQEDISFCERWKKDCGGEVWALLDCEISHVGDFAYQGSLWRLIQAAGKPASVQRPNAEHRSNENA